MVSRRRHTTYICDWSSDVCTSEHTISVWARSAGSAVDAAEKSAGTLYPIQPLISSLTLAANRAAPQAAGTKIGRASCREGGRGAVRDEWWTIDDVSWCIG